MEETATNFTVCGIANLLAAIFGVDAARVRQRLGIPPERAKNYCLNCKKPVAKHRKCCSRKCQNEWKHIKIECAVCGKLFARRQSRVLRFLKQPQRNGKLQEHFFCSKSCCARWLGKHFGFAAYPEHAWRPS